MQSGSWKLEELWRHDIAGINYQMQFFEKTLKPFELEHQSLSIGKSPSKE